MGKTKKIAIIGSGNFGSVIAKLVGENVQNRDQFENEVRMWVYEEQIDGKNLTDLINEKNENVKYLPGIKLPKNVVADPSLENTVKDASVLVFVLPHAFVAKVCDQIDAVLEDDQRKNLEAINLIKGVVFENKSIKLISDLISEKLKIDKDKVAALSGPNVAKELGEESFCETAIGSPSDSLTKDMFNLFNNDYFKVRTTKDIEGVQLGGALKNAVALGAGLCDGLGMKNNTKATIIDIGLAEMVKFSKMFFNADEKTFYGSAGIADLITTCYAGRNRKFAEAFAKEQGKKSIEQIESENFNGQKIQGIGTVDEINQMINASNKQGEFPLFEVLNDIFFKNADPMSLFERLE